MDNKWILIIGTSKVILVSSALQIVPDKEIIRLNKVGRGGSGLRPVQSKALGATGELSALEPEL